MDGVFYEGADLEALADMPNYYGWIMDAFAPYVRGHVVEYGAGMGTFSSHLEPRAVRLTLVEPSANLIPQLSARLSPSAKVNIFESPLEAHVSNLAPDSVDTIVLVNVLEHIADDREALRLLVRALKRGGHLLLFVPALQFLMSKLDRQVGHFRRYHRPDLRDKVAATGATVETCRYMDLFGAFAWFGVNTLLGVTKFNPKMIAVNDRFVVPASRVVERIFGAPFGKNLLLVARK